MKHLYEYTIKRKKVCSSVNFEQAATTPEVVADYLIQIGLNEEEVEKFVVIILDNKLRIKGHHIVASGTINRCCIDMRLVFRPAILHNAYTIIVAHNHPSGITTPSKQDTDLTKTIAATGKILGIKVVDHVIIGNGFYSYSKETTHL